MIVRSSLYAFCAGNYTFPGGAVVAQSPVKRLVVGSNPTRGAIKNSPKNIGLFLLPEVGFEH